MTFVTQLPPDLYPLVMLTVTFATGVVPSVSTVLKGPNEIYRAVSLGSTKNVGVEEVVVRLYFTMKVTSPRAIGVRTPGEVKAPISGGTEVHSAI